MAQQRMVVKIPEYWRELIQNEEIFPVDEGPWDLRLGGWGILFRVEAPKVLSIYCVDDSVEYGEDFLVQEFSLDDIDSHTEKTVEWEDAIDILHCEWQPTADALCESYHRAVLQHLAGRCSRNHASVTDLLTLAATCDPVGVRHLLKTYEVALIAHSVQGSRADKEGLLQLAGGVHEHVLSQRQKYLGHDADDTFLSYSSLVSYHQDLNHDEELQQLCQELGDRHVLVQRRIEVDHEFLLAMNKTTPNIRSSKRHKPTLK